jgi:hypothetical protein
MDEPTEAENEQPFVAYATKGCPDIVISVSEEFHGIRMSAAGQPVVDGCGESPLSAVVALRENAFPILI